MSRRNLRPEFYLLLATIVLSGLTAILLFARPLTARQEKSKPKLELRVADQSGRMRVDWNAADPMIRSAQGATLEVEDGGAFNRYPVEPNILRSGGLDYVRRSEDVLLTLTLYHDGHPGIQSSVRRIAPLDLQVAATPAAKNQGQSRSRTGHGGDSPIRFSRWVFVQDDVQRYLDGAAGPDAEREAVRPTRAS